MDLLRVAPFYMELHAHSYLSVTAQCQHCFPQRDSRAHAR